MRFTLGLDLGQMQDYTAIAVTERIAQSKVVYHLRHLQRFPLRTAYPAIVTQVDNLVRRPELLTQTLLAVDHTGVGVAVMNMLEDAHLPCPLFGITIHGGDTVTSEGAYFRVPKRELISLTQVLLQSERLKIAQALPEASLLVKELLDYRVKIDTRTAHDSYNAREGAHDDLVLAVALACWAGERFGEVVLPFRV